MNYLSKEQMHTGFIIDEECALAGSNSSPFEKYKRGDHLPFSAFKPYSTDVSDDGSLEDSPEMEHQGRGPYRKYTLQ
jgi:hypothetical protein